MVPHGAPAGLSTQLRLKPEDIAEQLKLIEDAMRLVMKEGEDYGTIPGVKKPSLWKPGAEKLGVLFRFAPRYVITQTDLGDGHREVRSVCDLYHVGTGEWFGQGVGSCSTLESKYRWRTAKRICPDCGEETVKRSQFKDEWYCHEKAGGCGHTWPFGTAAIEGQELGKRENPDIADQYNTVLKMSQKRAHVAVTLTATGASAIFSADLEDDDDPEEKTPAKKTAPPKGKAEKRQAQTPAEDMRPKSKPTHGAGLTGAQCSELWSLAVEHAKKTGATRELIIQEILAYLACKDIGAIPATDFGRVKRLIGEWEPGINFGEVESAMPGNNMAGDAR
jgi:ribosomal protein L37AE/L43A